MAAAPAAIATVDAVSAWAIDEAPPSVLSTNRPPSVVEARDDNFIGSLFPARRPSNIGRQPGQSPGSSTHPLRFADPYARE